MDPTKGRRCAVIGQLQKRNLSPVEHKAFGPKLYWNELYCIRTWITRKGNYRQRQRMKYTLFAIGLLVALVQGQEPEAVPTTPFNCVSGAADALKLVSQATGSGITPARCVATCVSADLPFAFVAGGFEGNCFCSSNASPSGASVLPLSVCDTVCADGISRGCGGLNDTAVGTFAVYAVTFDLVVSCVKSTMLIQSR